MIIDEIKKILATSLGIDVSDIIYPPSSDLGDFSWPIFKAAKEQNVSAPELAEKIKNSIVGDKKLNKIFAKVEVKGAYLNFFVFSNYLITQVIKTISEHKGNYGRNNSGQNEVSVFEFSNVNTHKTFHIGHLRNISFGDSIYKISLANGFKAYPISYINDFGIHTAKALWSYKQKFSNDLNACYAQTVKEIEENPLVVKEVGAIKSDIEKRQGLNYRLWKKTRKMSLLEFNNIYKKLKIKFKKTYFESDVIDRGIKLVDNFVKKNILVKSEGAIIANLEKFDLGVLPVIRSDGTALYPVADFALAEVKAKAFKNMKNSFIIVDIRQSLHFKQLFKVLNLAGFKQKFIHLAHEFITLPEGMMSSRSGNAVAFIDLYNQTVEKLIVETKTRRPNWSNKKIKLNCEKLAVAVLKFEMLKVATTKIITFDIKEATKFDGFSALYILYGLVRIKSILNKNNFSKKNKFNVNLLDDKLEKEIALKLAKYPDVVKKAYSDYNPSEIAKYLFELFKIFNDYYQKVNIMQSEIELRKARLAFIYSISQVATNALGLLGIESLEEI